MNTPEKSDKTTPPVSIVPLGMEHESGFLASVAHSRPLHRPWVAPPATAEAFAAAVAKSDGDRHQSYLALDDAGGFVGCINLNEIVRGAFQSAYLGYYAFAPYAGTGLMKLAMALVIDKAFGELQLHRLESNIQPGNTASIALVKSLGFRHEGFSPRYLHIAGQWRDHERYAITQEDQPTANPPTATSQRGTFGRRLRAIQRPG